jgi:fructose-specific phosphotransferase system component IIB
MLKTYRSLKVDRKDFVAFLVSRLKLERDVADETAAVMIEGQTKNGMIDETDLQAIIEAERQIVQVDKPIKVSDVADYSLIREILNNEKGQ